MEKNESKEEKEQEQKPPVIDDDDVYFFNPWDDEFTRDLKRDQTKFDF